MVIAEPGAQPTADVILAITRVLVNYAICRVKSATKTGMRAPSVRHGMPGTSSSGFLSLSVKGGLALRGFAGDKDLPGGFPREFHLQDVVC